MRDINKWSKWDTFFLVGNLIFIIIMIWQIFFPGHQQKPTPLPSFMNVGSKMNINIVQHMHDNEYNIGIEDKNHVIKNWLDVAGSLKIDPTINHDYIIRFQDTQFGKWDQDTNFQIVVKSIHDISAGADTVKISKTQTETYQTQIIDSSN